MSFWSHDRWAGIALITLPCFLGSAHAAQYYFQPIVEVGVEEDTNRNLIPAGDRVNAKDDAFGFSTDAVALLGIATPTTNTTLRPEVAYADWPQLDNHDLRTSLDLATQARSEVSQVSVEGRFDRESTYSSELASPIFNTINPNLPTTPETGRISSDTTRTLLTLVPTYTRDITSRLTWGVNTTFQVADYSGEDASAYIPYNYYLAGTNLGWKYSQRLTFTAGAFASYEDAHDHSGRVNADGGNVTADYKWTTQLSSSLLVQVESDDTTAHTGNGRTLHGTSTAPGATFTTNWKGQISTVQLSMGRTYSPSGAGGLFRTDQVQIQLDRDLSQRMTVEVAGRVINATSITSLYINSDYDYVNVETRLKWKITPTWYVAGGVQYVRNHFEPPVGTAENGTVYVSFGYQGLNRPY